MSYHSDKLMQIYQLMLDFFGTQNWWPGDTDLEICIGAILTQNTNWKNAHKAICNLKENNALDLNVIHTLPDEELAELIRPSGYYNQKAKKLKNFAQYALTHANGFDDLYEKPTDMLRNELLAIKGIGPETADDMVLYAFNRPVFVIDTYTWRIMYRHELCDESISYNDLADFFISNLDNDTELFSEYHALIVQVGKNYCKKTNPKCEACPLNILF